jgi:hypothetical protein
VEQRSECIIDGMHGHAASQKSMMEREKRGEER